MTNLIIQYIHIYKNFISKIDTNYINIALVLSIIKKQYKNKNMFIDSK